MNFWAKISTIFDHTIKLSVILAMLVLMSILLIITAQVVLRLFGYTTIWVNEVTEYFLLYIVFLGTAWVLKKEGHIKMDLVLVRLRPRAQVLLNIITSILCAIICLAIVWYGAKITWEFFQIGYIGPGLLRIPQAPIVVIIPVGSLLLFIQFLRRTHGYLGRLKMVTDKEQGLQRNAKA